VWCTTSGRGLDYRHIGEAFRVAIRRSGVASSGRLSLHSLRHGYASLLIGQGLPLLFISRQLSHSKPSMTLNVYAHEFARREVRPRGSAGAGERLRGARGGPALTGRTNENPGTAGGAPAGVPLAIDRVCGP
jgi:hypothetical protein